MEDTAHDQRPNHEGNSHNNNHSSDDEEFEEEEDDDDEIPLRCSHHNMTTDAVLDITLAEPGARTILRHFPNLKTLYVRYTPADDGGNHPIVGVNGYSVTTECIIRMFELLAKHEQLRNIVVDSLEDMEADERCHCHFPLRALTILLEKASQLTSIELDLNTALTGTEEDGQAFLRALQNHPTLDCLEIGDFGNQNSSISAERFSPLCISQKWRVLTIAHNKHQITEEQVEQNIKSPTLKRLWIDTGTHGPFQRHFPRIFEILRTNACNIMEFNSLVDLTDETAGLCASMVRGNTTLQNLYLSLGVESRHGITITGSLLQNSNIQSLRLIMSGERNGDAKEMIRHLEHNQALKHVHFHLQGIFDCSRVREVFMEPFAEILEQNCVLEELEMDTCHKNFDLTPEIQFYLSLNKVGRKQLRDAPSNSRQQRSIWVNTIIQNRLDPTVVFYFISESPSFLPCA